MFSPLLARAKWRVKLERAFNGKGENISLEASCILIIEPLVIIATDGSSKAGKWLLLILPYITVLREGVALAR